MPTKIDPFKLNLPINASQPVDIAARKEYFGFVLDLASESYLVDVRVNSFDGATTKLGFSTPC